MKYYQVRASFKPFKSKLNRTMLIRENASLIEFGFALSTIINSMHEHMFLFEINRYLSYTANNWCDSFLGHNNLPMKDYKISDLPKKFIFCYDTGENYEFEITIKEELLDGEKYYDDVFKEYALIVPLSYTGLGIFEDNITSLYMYLKGKINPDYSGSEDDYDKPQLPWNLPMETFGDFDVKGKYDDDEQQTINAEAIDVYNENKQGYIIETNY